MATPGAPGPWLSPRPRARAQGAGPALGLGPSLGLVPGPWAAWGLGAWALAPALAPGPLWALGSGIWESTGGTWASINRTASTLPDLWQKEMVGALQTSMKCALALSPCIFFHIPLRQATGCLNSGRPLKQGII